jgi:hypothetical protein
MATDDQIQALRHKAAADGDDMLECICTIALEGPIASFEDRFGGGGLLLTASEQRKLETMSQSDALAKCQQAISADG